MKHYSHNLGKLSFSLFVMCFALVGASLQAQVTSLNVSDFGAQGDAIQFWVSTTSNSVVVTTTNQLSGADIGKAIEIFRAGPQTVGINFVNVMATNNQDLVTTIANVVNGTNIYVTQAPQATLTNAFATYGHNNQASFQAAIAACGQSTNTIINIAAGTYLILSTLYNASVYGNAGIVLTGGGIHFVGAGTNKTTLLSQGAWILQNGYVNRGFLFVIRPPITNDYPLSFENLVMDGGVQQGNTPDHGVKANIVDGQGWDQTHDAILVRGIGNTLTHQTWTNVVFTHWRGEMVKSNDVSTNGNLSIFNCVFADGNATAINIYPSLNISNCVFANLFQVAEYYQAYSTNTSYFQNNLITNITANTFAINGGKGNNPPFIIQNNTFYLPGNGYNGIETVPADNVFIISNQFICLNYANVIVLGAAGYQGTCDNSNIVIAGNTVVNPTTFVEMSGATSSTDPSRVESVLVYGNVLKQSQSMTLLKTYGWTTNIHFFSNDCSQIIGSVGVSSGNYGSQYSLVDANNSYYTWLYDLVGITNYISYSNGSRFQMIWAYFPGTVYALSDLDSNQIPSGAQMLIKNNITPRGGYPQTSFPLYLNSSLTKGPLIVTNGASMLFTWMNGSWQLEFQVTGLQPPTNLRMISP